MATMTPTLRHQRNRQVDDFIPNLPGADLVGEGIATLDRGERTTEALLVSLAAIAALALAGCSAGTGEGRMTVEERVCARSLERLAERLGPDDELGGVRSITFQFKEIAATWTPGDPPLDVRQWVDDARLIHRIQNNCHSPETSVLVNIGGRLRLVDITVRPVPNPRPARRGRVDILDLPPADAEDTEEAEEAEEEKE